MGPLSYKKYKFWAHRKRYSINISNLDSKTLTHVSDNANKNVWTWFFICMTLTRSMSTFSTILEEAKKERKIKKVSQEVFRIVKKTKKSKNVQSLDFVFFLFLEDFFESFLISSENRIVLSDQHLMSQTRQL